MQAMWNTKDFLAECAPGVKIPPSTCHATVAFMIQLLQYHKTYNLMKIDAPNPSLSATGEDQVGLIVNKRVTRRLTLYEVSTIHVDMGTTSNIL